MKLKKVALVIAVDDQNGIGKNGGLAWNIKEDMDFFRTLTTTTKKEHRKNAVVMGRKTWESIPEKFRPLPGRINCILSSAYGKTPTEIAENTFGFADFEDCHIFLSKRVDVENIFIIGGSFLYNMMLDSPHLETLYLTRVYGDFSCDTFFSPIPDTFSLASQGEKKKQGDIEYQMLVYKAKETGFHFFQDLKIPSVFMTRKFLFYTFALIVAFILIGLSFSFFGKQKIDTPENPSVKEENTSEDIKEVSSSGQTDMQALPESELQDTPAAQTEEDIVVSENSGEEVISSLSPRKREEEANTDFSYPEIGVPEKAKEISDYLMAKKLEFKIVNFNERKNDSSVIWKIDYVETENEIMFSEYKNEEKIGEKKISLK